MKAILNSISFACGLLCLSTVSGAADHPSVIRVVENAEGFLFTQGKAKILFYQRKPKSHHGKFQRANYIHPLYDLEGNVLTEDFPSDHRHHRGIFWAWHQVWVGEKKIGDPWTTKDFVWDVKAAKVDRTDPGSAVLKIKVEWKSPKFTDANGREKSIVSETTEIRVHQAAQNVRLIDFTISLLALQPEVRLGGSEDAKGYGGFSARFRLPPDVRFTSPKGPVVPQRLSVDASPWMDFTGTFGETDQLSGIAILCHPSLRGFPPRWILRQSRSMQNPLYPGREPVALSRKAPLVFRYRLVMHRGIATKTTIEKWHAQYAAMPRD